MNKTKILFVAQTPPPFRGQEIVHQYLLEGNYSSVELRHVPMRYSSDPSEQGSVTGKKIAVLIRLIIESYRISLREGIQHLYFSPGGPCITAVIRDAIYLLAVRWRLRKMIIVHHGSGLAEYMAGFPFPLNRILKRIFSGVQVAVQLGPSTPNDGPALLAEKTLYIPNAIPDAAGGWFARPRRDVCRILFVGVVCEGKGVGDLLRAAKIAFSRGAQLEIVLMGSFAMGQEVAMRAVANDLPSSAVYFTGPLNGEAKWAEFRKADFFCFPSFWPGETFPVVLLEALCFGLPIIATNWRGIPDVVGRNDDCGVLVEVGAVETIATVMHGFAADTEARTQMSRNSRRRFEENFTLGRFYSDYDYAFAEFTSRP